MYPRTPFFIYIAMFILTWPAHFAVRGTPKTRKELCMERGYDAACTFSGDRNPCQVLTCGYKKRTLYSMHEIILINDVPDLTECGESKICRNGECVNANGPMPHYRRQVRYVNCEKMYRHGSEHVPTRREQCQSYGFDVACEAPDGPIDDDCSHLNCGYEGPNEFYFTRSREKLPISLVPNTGTWCGDNKACYRNACISLEQWPLSYRLPTYSCPEVFDICCPEIEN